MREILFRGKRKGDGKWQYGGLHIVEWDETRKGRGRDIDYRILGRRGECCYVAPETVGQYTGLKDKNGNRIFEGDIVKWYMNFVVVQQKCHYVLKKDVDNEFFDYVLSCFSGNELEVIGNIHDNPELLKEGGEE